MPTDTIGQNSSNTYSGFVETWISEGTPTTNYSSSTGLEVNKYQAGGWNMVLCKATGIASLPADAVISAVSLFFYVNAADLANGTYVISAKRLRRDWVTAQATWNVWSTSNNWTTGGAQGDGTDREATATFATAGLGLSTGYVELVGNSTAVADVQAMRAGSMSNFGWMLERTDGQNDFAFRNLQSSLNTDGVRPYLSVTYTTAPPQFFQYRWPHQLHARR